MLLIRAMIAASNADHDIDDEERGRTLTAQVSTKEMAREVYLASLMAIDVDTPAEIRYLARLAERMGLDDHAVAELEATLEDD